MNLTIMVISFVSILLVMAGVTLWISHYLRIPFTILLVISGYLLSHLAKIGPAFVQPFANYKIDPDIILYACCQR